MSRLFKSLRFLVLVGFLGFQAAQSLHTHAANVQNKDCAVCQVVHQTPSLGASAQPTVARIVVCERHLAVSHSTLLTSSSHCLALSRAPPLA